MMVCPCKGVFDMTKPEIKDKPLLTIEEAALLYNIGEHKLRELTDDNNCQFVLFVGRKRLIKRRQFDTFLDRIYSV